MLRTPTFSWICALALLPGMAGLAAAAEIKCMEQLHEHGPAVAQQVKDAIGIVPAPTSCTTLLIRGPIVPGDTARLRRAFRASGGLIATVNLDSPGGDIREAMDMGRFIRSTLISTNSAIEYMAGEQFFPPVTRRGLNPCREGQCACASACFVVWTAGLNRAGHTLGVHRPRFDPTYFSGLDLPSAQRQYSEALNALKAYYQEMDVPADYYERMVSTSSADLRSLSRSEAEALWVKDYPPAIDEWLVSKCGAFTAAELEQLLALGSRTAGSGSASTPDQAPGLLDKMGTVNSCRARVIVQTRFGLAQKLPSSN